MINISTQDMHLLCACHRSCFASIYISLKFTVALEVGTILIILISYIKKAKMRRGQAPQPRSWKTQSAFKALVSLQNLCPQASTTSLEVNLCFHTERQDAVFESRFSNLFDCEPLTGMYLTLQTSMGAHRELIKPHRTILLACRCILTFPFDFISKKHRL